VLVVVEIDIAGDLDPGFLNILEPMAPGGHSLGGAVEPQTIGPE
jgi:hypothetical protein